MSFLVLPYGSLCGLRLGRASALLGKATTTLTGVAAAHCAHTPTVVEVSEFVRQVPCLGRIASLGPCSPAASRRPAVGLCCCQGHVLQDVRVVGSRPVASSVRCDVNIFLVGHLQAQFCRRGFRRDGKQVVIFAHVPMLVYFAGVVLSTLGGLWRAWRMLDASVTMPSLAAAIL